MKKTLALLLAVVLVVGMGVTGFAATAKITDITDDVFVDKAENGSYFDMTDATLKPGETIRIYIDPKALSVDPMPENGIEVTTRLLDDSNVSLRYTVSKGKDLIESIELDTESKTNPTTKKTYKLAYIRVELVETYKKTTATDLDVTISLQRSGQRVSTRITGTMENEEIEVSADDGGYFELEEGQMLKPTEYIRDAEVYIGNDVSILSSLTKNKKYLATCREVMSESDEAVLDRYPEIQYIYLIDATGFSSEAKVRFDLGDTFYVYNKEGKYVGTTDDEDGVAFSEKYYLAETKINISGNSRSSSEEDPEEEEEEEGGSANYPDPSSQTSDGDETSTPYSGNDNPDTGTKALVNVAILAGVMAVVAAGIMIKKR